MNLHCILPACSSLLRRENIGEIPAKLGASATYPPTFVIRLRPAGSRSQVDGREDGVPHMPENSAAHVSSAFGQHHAGEIEGKLCQTWSESSRRTPNGQSPC